MVCSRNIPRLQTSQETSYNSPIRKQPWLRLEWDPWQETAVGAFGAQPEAVTGLTNDGQ